MTEIRIQRKDNNEVITIEAKNKADFYRQVDVLKCEWELFAWYWRHKWFK